MIRLARHVVVLLVSGQALFAADGTSAVSSEPAELREPPPVEDVRFITANWFDDGYGSFVRWSVPDKQWESVLEAVSDSREQEPPETGAAPPMDSNQLHLRIVTTDGRSLTIVAGSEGGELKAFPFRGCREAFQFADHGGPFLRERLGTAFRTAIEQRRSSSDAGDDGGN